MATFKEAFAAARKSGKKEFTWNGKRYNTKVKGEGSSASSPRPKARPGSSAKPKTSSATTKNRGSYSRGGASTKKSKGPSRGLPGLRRAVKRVVGGGKTSGSRTRRRDR